tara:strand:+ start:2132 stop:2401 length:270 start_codon:yes stop_codon:yes gene_type:complete
MSEYADGFDDGKGEKFDELMVEIVALRQQLKDCSAVVDRQQEQLDRSAEQLADKQAKIDALMFEYCPIEMSLEQIARWKKHQVVKEEKK